MTNAEIIYRTSIELAKNGVLEMVTEDQPEPIHTFAKWKELGYSVKKGEKSGIKFAIWKYRPNIKVDEKTGEEIDDSKMFPKVSAFFKFSQVEKIAK